MQQTLIITMDQKLKIGCHLSCAKGYAAMGQQAIALGANVFQFFSRNPRGTRVKSVSEDDVNLLKQLMLENNFGKLLIHAPYTLNICSDDNKIADIAYKIVAEDIKTLEKYLPGNMYNMHPGYRGERNLSEAIQTATNLLNSIITENQTTTVLLETMSGKGTEVGGIFEELKSIISMVNFPEKIGVCLDTCHVFAAGYDIVNCLDDVLEEFDKVIGIEKLLAVHLNDSIMPLASHKDRHSPIGKGEIGLNAIERFINHEHIKNLPFYLETPDNGTAHLKEIKLVKSIYKYEINV